MADFNRYTKIAAERSRELNEEIRKADNVLKLTRQVSDEFMRHGKAEIHVDVSQIDIYNPLSYQEHRRMNSEIFDFVEGQANLLPSLVPLRLILHGMPTEEQDTVREMIRQHYDVVLQDQLWDKRSNRNRMLFMIVIGVVFLSGYLLLALNREDTLFLEILSVIGSFSLWEAANCFLVERRSLNRAMRETAQFLTMEVQFAEP